MSNQSKVVTPAEMYEAFFVPAIFGPWAEELVLLAGVAEGESVLDLACGTGIVARTAAPIVGRRGRVTALDLRPGMLAAARALPAPNGATIEWIEGDALDTKLPDATFDHVICQAGLQFFPDRLRALIEMRRVLKEGGRLTVHVWQAMDKQPVWDALAVSEFRHLEPLGVTMDEVCVPFSLGDVEELRGLLREAGFRQIAVSQQSRDARFPQPDTFVQNMEFAYAAVVPELAADQDAFQRFVEAVTEETRDIVSQYTEDNHVVFPMYANIASGRR